MSVSVVVDDREPAGVAAAFRARPDVSSVAVERLAAGDVAIGTVGFERKTAGDCLSSALGRTGSDLREQVRTLGEGYDHAYVLLKATLADVEAVSPGVQPAAVRGSIASITARSGVPVLPCGDRECLVDVTVRLARKHVEDPSSRPLPPGAVTARHEPVAKRMYACIEGIGPETAAALYEAFPTVESLLAATEDDLLAVEGVGPKRATAVYDAVRTDG